MNYLALTRTGSGLLGASYGGGYGIGWPMSKGVAEEPSPGSAFPNLHAVLPSDDGQVRVLRLARGRPGGAVRPRRRICD